MIALAAEDLVDLRRWVISGAIVVLAHGALAAVVIYNVFARSTASYRALLGDAAAEVLRLASRDLDRPAAMPAAPVRRARPLSAAAE